MPSSFFFSRPSQTARRNISFGTPSRSSTTPSSRNETRGQHRPPPPTRLGQFTQALRLASLTSHHEHFRYLCCLNSDRIPTSGFPDSFDWRHFVKLTLRDGAPDGGLFGFGFGEGAGRTR